MLYFRNVDLAKKYHISLGTVRNWIEAAKEGKLDLYLHEKEGKSHIANTSKNILIIERLAEKGRKYKNTRGYKMVGPSTKFYETYNRKEIIDIISNLEIYREIPLQYGYFNGGAVYWDEYARRLASEETSNNLNATLKLFEMNQSYIDRLLAPYKRVNVVDLGVGNGMPVRGLLEHLLQKGKLGRYIGIDISPDMLKIAEHNIKEWFGEAVAFEGHKRDISYERFASLLVEEYFRKDSQDTANLVLALGDPLGNFKDPDNIFTVVHDSMGLNDFLIYQRKLDTEASRRYFDFNSQPNRVALAPNQRLIFDLLNIDDSLCNVEMGFDPGLRQRYIRMRLKVALTIKFEFEGGERLVDLNKDDTILLWRSWHQSALEVINQLDRNNFYFLHASQTEDEEFLLTVSRVKRDR